MIGTNYRYGCQLLNGILILWLSILSASAEPPPHSLIWPSDNEHLAAQVGAKSSYPSIGPHNYCDPGFRSRLISLATAANVNIGNPERLTVFAGWLDLVQAVDQEPCTEQNAVAAIRAWRLSHRKHPAVLLFPKLFGSEQQGLHLGVLLPLQGEMEAFSQIIVAGMTPVAEAHGINITVIDSIELIDSLAKDTNILSGFDCIIGPLEKQRVEQFALSQPTLPVLTLNYLPIEAPTTPRLFQITLHPEDEAYALADLIAEADHKQGVLLYTEEHAWSERMAAALMNRWDRYGGRLEPYVINAKQTDFAAALKKVLQISESEIRHKEIEGLLGYPVKFKPRRRQDIEFVVILVDQRLGRMLKPQLKFWYAGGLPVYSTSKLLSANSFTVNNDLDGVHLTLPPWIAFESSQIDTNSEAILEQSLHFLGESAIRIVHASRCLSGGTLLLDQSLEPAWVFDQATRRFHYRSRHAVIKDDRINY